MQLYRSISSDNADDLEPVIASTMFACLSGQRE